MVSSTAHDTHAVLVVEDDADVREAVTVLIESEGEAVQAIGAADGREAMAYLRDHPPPCLVLLDLMMPVVNGWQVIDWLRQRPDLNDVPVVVLSAATRERRKDVIATGRVASFLQKPCRAEDLLAAIQRHCPGAIGT